ncbi:unnamed protein product [Bemisia tabaci]|uniref:C-type lectin domain-containing protein n=1 Tax=Bemisia tabaci TaxID=7038 RepID=A0A9P0AN76_BEMTA|nr:PREDICTED: uncharacterized protein LOC109040211 [Bemisia tabaci]CAH0395445.1 unnamed protein product [Bemisia tabaci]
MFKFLVISSVCVAAALAAGSFPGGRFLEQPKPELCAQRKIHETFKGLGYYFSWKEPATQGEEHDWLGGRNWCRQRCMDLVSLRDPAKNEYVKNKIVEGKQKYIWTSGRACDFEGCEREDLQPARVNGWFWTANFERLPPTSDRTNNDWSEGGGIGLPQPDNREVIQQGGPNDENCLAILNNFYNDGVHWHDVACHHLKPWVCEDSEPLLKWVKYNNPQLAL